MGFASTEQTKKTKYGYCPDQNMGIKQTKQRDMWVLPGPNRPKYGFFQTEHTADRKTDINQTDKWLLTRPKRRKCG